MDLASKLIYLDREFVSNLYESETGYSPATQITKTEGLQASAVIPLFSAGASSVESKSYSVSTLGMLRALEEKVRNFPRFDESAHDFGKASAICWLEGTLTINKVEVKRSKYTLTLVGEPKDPQSRDGERLVAEEYYFAVESGIHKVALIPTKDYFTSGVASFKELADTVVGPIELPVNALVRVFSAQTAFKQWISVPLVILEP